MSSRIERRRSRRSSPDAPQGFAPVLVVIAGLAVVVAFTAAGMGGHHHEARVTSVTTVSGKSPRGRQTQTTAPTTAVIEHADQTTLFVTTTTPITTSSSTTTSIPGGPAFATLQSTVTIDADTGSVAVRLYNQWPRATTFLVIGVPPGMKVTPGRATIPAGSSTRVVLRITDPDVAASGSLIFAGENDTTISVGVVLASSGPSITSLRLQPAQPVCNQPTVLTLTTSPGVQSVSVTLTADPTDPLEASATGQNTWSVLVPAQSAGTVLAGSATATDARGRTASKAFSATVSNDWNCVP